MARYGMVLNLKTCVGCGACIAACALENQTPYWDDKYRTHVEDVITGVFPSVSREFIPRLCMQCENPPCVSACPTKASHIAEGGIVLVDQNRCIGCKACMVACPYDARYVYDRKDVKRAHALYAEDLVQVLPHIDKCTFCKHRLDEGREPACAETCPTDSRIFGDLDDPESEVHCLSTSGIAKPLKPEMGTNPKVFYIF